MDTLRGIECFVRAVEAGSIAAAARRLGISAAATSQNIARLESYLGVRLLTRTTRSLAMTDAGKVYYHKVALLIHELELARAALSDVQQELQGRLCIASTAAFSRHVLAPLIPAFNRLHPKLAIEMTSTDRRVDHVQESVDLSIRIKQQLDEGMVARKIARVPTIFCASPAYIARAGKPLTPADLRQHDCLVFRLAVDGRFLRWGFIENGLRFEADVRVAIISDDIDVLARLAAAGGGVTRLAAFVAKDYIQRGELIELFCTQDCAGFQTEIEPLDIYACVRDRHQLTPKVRAFMDYLTAALPAEWRVE